MRFKLCVLVIILFLPFVVFAQSSDSEESLIRKYNYKIFKDLAGNIFFAIYGDGKDKNCPYGFAKYKAKVWSSSCYHSRSNCSSKTEWEATETCYGCETLEGFSDNVEKHFYAFYDDAAADNDKSVVFNFEGAN